MKITQRFAVASHSDGLAVTLYLLGFSDLAFSWSTTLDISANTFHRIVEAFAVPWQFLGPDWQLSLEQVRDTQYFRLEGRYVPSTGEGRATDMIVIGHWWHYL